MPPQDETGEKTEDATPRQREKAREEGRVASSREVGTLFILTTATLAIYFFGPYMTRRLLGLFAWVLQNLHTIDLSTGGAAVLLRSMFVQVMLILGPVFIALVVAAVAGWVFQFGFLFSSRPLQFKGDRINPIEGAKRLFSWRLLMETFKSIFKFSIVAIVCYYLFKPLLPWSAAMVDSDPLQIIPALLYHGMRIALFLLLFLLIVAVADYAFQRWEFEKSIRMSRYEVKQELKETEGDPQIRARVRSIRQQQLRQRMMAEVPTAEVVVTNPTHYAVALRYDPVDRDAPHVVALGRSLIAQRIKEIATENDVPIYEEPWLARELYRTCYVGDTIPVDLWQAVAKVLAYIRTLDRKRIAVAAGAAP
jgi:flagellar biosynthetic protein FlhB